MRRARRVGVGCVAAAGDASRNTDSRLGRTISIDRSNAARRRRAAASRCAAVPAGSSVGMRTVVPVDDRAVDARRGRDRRRRT